MATEPSAFGMFETYYCRPKMKTGSTHSAEVIARRRAVSSVSLLVLVAVALSSGIASRELQAVGRSAAHDSAGVKFACTEARRTATVASRQQDHKPVAARPGACKRPRSLATIDRSESLNMSLSASPATLMARTGLLDLPPPQA